MGVGKDASPVRLVAGAIRPWGKTDRDVCHTSPATDRGCLEAGSE